MAKLKYVKLRYIMREYIMVHLRTTFSPVIHGSNRFRRPRRGREQAKDRGVSRMVVL